MKNNGHYSEHAKISYNTRLSILRLCSSSWTWRSFTDFVCLRNKSLFVIE